MSPVPEEEVVRFSVLIVILEPFAPISSTAVKVRSSTSPMAILALLVLVIDPPDTRITSFASCALSGSALASIAPTKITSPPAFTNKPTELVPSPSPLASKVTLLN